MHNQNPVQNTKHCQGKYFIGGKNLTGYFIDMHWSHANFSNYGTKYATAQILVSTAPELL